MGKKSIKTCYICASTISRDSNDDERFNEKNVKTTRKVLLKYLLKNRDKSKTLYTIIANYVSKHDNSLSVCSVQFCTSCDQQAEKVGKLLLKLSTIQKNLDEEIEETRKKVADASKVVSKLLDNDGYGSTQKKNEFLSTLRKFQKCVEIKTSIDLNNTDSLYLNAGVITIKNDNDDNNLQLASRAAIANEQVSKPLTLIVKKELIRDSSLEESSESNDDKVEDDDRGQGLCKEEEILNCNTDVLNANSRIDLQSKRINDNDSSSDCINISQNHDRTSPPSIIKVTNNATSIHLVKERLPQIQIQASASANLKNKTSRLAQEKRYKNNRPTTSSYVPLQNPQQKGLKPQYVIVTQLQPSLNEEGSVPPPKIFPLNLELTPPVPTELLSPKPELIELPSATDVIKLENKESDFEDAVEKIPSKTSKKRLYSCKSCSFPLVKSYKEFEQHLRIHETPTKNYTCTTCKMQFTTKQMHDLHKKFHNLVYSTKCDICSQTVEILNTKKHLESSHQVDPIPCPYCSQCFGKYYGLLCHLKLHTKTPIKCVICPDSIFKARKLLANHFIEFHGIDEDDVFIKCDVPECTATFFDVNYKTLHMRQHEKTFECPTCGKCFGVASKLKQHSKMHTEGKVLFSCDVCPGKSFKSNVGLLTHQMKEHGAPKFQCDQCVKAFYGMVGLLYHKTHTHADIGDIELHPCPICGKKLATKASCRNHMLTHSDSKDFICSECGFQTKSKVLLKHHEKRHFGEKTHKCPYCPKVFLTSKILKIHVRVHTKERPYVCDICGSDFNQRSAMMSHRKRHADTTFVPRGSKPRKRRIN